MKLQLPTDNWKSRGPPPLIFYNPDPTISNIPTEKSDSQILTSIPNLGIGIARQ